MTGFALFLQETLKCVPEGSAGWKNISEEAKQVSDVSVFALGTAHF